MRLSGYFNKLQNYIADCKEYQRQVDRERDMVCGGNIVLLDEFKNCFKVSKPNGRPSGYHHLMIDDDMTEFMVRLSERQKQGGAVGFSIPFNCLIDERKEFLRARYESGRNTMNAFLDMIKENGTQEDYEFFKSFDHVRTHDTAFYLSELLDIADEMGAGLKSCDNIAILTGNGKTAVKFWKAVNDLHDYSHLFPHRPPGPGKKAKDREGVHSPAKGWKPAFNN